MTRFRLVVRDHRVGHRRVGVGQHRPQVESFADHVGREDSRSEDDERVPAVDELYDGRIAAADGLAITLAAVLAAGHELGVGSPVVLVSAGALAGIGATLVAANLVGILVVHGPQSLPERLGGWIATDYLDR